MEADEIGETAVVGKVLGLKTMGCVIVGANDVTGEGMTVEISIFNALDVCVTEGIVDVDWKAFIDTVELEDLDGLTLGGDVSGMKTTDCVTVVACVVTGDEVTFGVSVAGDDSEFIPTVCFVISGDVVPGEETTVENRNVDVFVTCVTDGIVGFD